MTKTNLAQAMCECRRFMDRARSLENLQAKTGEGHYWQSKESAAVRRASLDLTRALADLRRAE